MRVLAAKGGGLGTHSPRRSRVGGAADKQGPQTLPAVGLTSRRSDGVRRGRGKAGRVSFRKPGPDGEPSACVHLGVSRSGCPGAARRVLVHKPRTAASVTPTGPGGVPKHADATAPHAKLEGQKRSAPATLPALQGPPRGVDLPSSHLVARANPCGAPLAPHFPHRAQTQSVARSLQGHLHFLPRAPRPRCGRTSLPGPEPPHKDKRTEPARDPESNPVPDKWRPCALAVAVPALRWSVAALDNPAVQPELTCHHTEKRKTCSPCWSFH